MSLKLGGQPMVPSMTGKTKPTDVAVSNVLLYESFDEAYNHNGKWFRTTSGNVYTMDSRLVVSPTTNELRVTTSVDKQNVLVTATLQQSGDGGLIFNYNNENDFWLWKVFGTKREVFQKTFSYGLQSRGVTNYVATNAGDVLTIRAQGSNVYLSCNGQQEYTMAHQTHTRTFGFLARDNRGLGWYDFKIEAL